MEITISIHPFKFGKRFEFQVKTSISDASFGKSPVSFQEPLRLFALEPVDVVCLVAHAAAENGEPAPPENVPPEGWAELEYTEAPEVEGFGKENRGSKRPFFRNEKTERDDRFFAGKKMKQIHETL